jgi:glycosyltransferase involved in cell wall biosynthesis
MNGIPLFSIAVPTYSFGGRGEFFLNRLFDSLKEQTCQDLEVVVSDHSTDDEIKKYCQRPDYPFQVKYIRNTEDIGNSPANTNNAIENSCGHLIKILFQDDLLCHPQALEFMQRGLLNSTSSWTVCGSKDIILKENRKQSQRVPVWHPNLLKGHNTIGSPSIVAIKKSVEVRFDPELTFLMDCEFYHHMADQYGPPLIIPDIVVTNTIHGGQISNKFVTDPNFKSKQAEEVAYCARKHLSEKK